MTYCSIFWFFTGKYLELYYLSGCDEAWLPPWDKVNHNKQCWHFAVSLHNFHSKILVDLQHCMVKIYLEGYQAPVWFLSDEVCSVQTCWWCRVRVAENPGLKTAALLRCCCCMCCAVLCWYIFQFLDKIPSACCRLLGWQFSVVCCHLLSITPLSLLELC